ncbi:MAG: PIN domain-containing protein [Actinobacteria bacterium]|nr:PIN domain-containing protein [Actinomycetota bacterium]
MSVFVDTSFFIALLDDDEDRHGDAIAQWRWAAAERLAVLTSNYVVVESCAVLQRHIGVVAVRRLVRQVLDPVVVHWVTKEEHERATEALLVADRRQLSIVDCTSFEVMRRLDVRECLAYDRHFAEQGFSPLSPPAGAVE